MQKTTTFQDELNQPQEECGTRKAFEQNVQTTQEEEAEIEHYLMKKMHQLSWVKAYILVDKQL